MRLRPSAVSFLAFLQVGCTLLTIAGCQQVLNRTDEQVYSLIRQRQEQAVGLTPDSRIEPAKAPVRPDPSAYEFVPHPLDPEVPPEFAEGSAAPTPDVVPPAATRPDAGPPVESDTAAVTPPPASAAVPPAPTTQPYAAELPLAPDNEAATLPPLTAPEELPSPPAVTEAPPLPDATATQPVMTPMDVTAGLPDVPAGEPFSLQEAMAYAFRNARELQSAKENLYLSALALTLERHLWTPRWVASINSQVTSNPESAGDEFDRAMRTVADVAVTQRLPYGGAITARVVDTLIHNLREGVTAEETGRAALEATLPLLRGAGRVAYESRYRAERDLIYAVRDYEQFRRQFAVEIATDYFNLLELRQRIVNARQGLASFEQTYSRALAMFEAGRVIALDVQRAQQETLTARNDVIDAVEQYELALDEFKVAIGMPTTQPIAIVEELPELPIPRVPEPRAIEVALRMRLDLINAQDRVEDARRGVVVARNGLLPDLGIGGAIDFATDPNEFGTLGYQDDETSWRADISLDLPLDRKAEINRYRASHIDLARARRAFELAGDRVRLQVRRAIRQIEQARFSLQIQQMNMDLAARRRDYAQLRFQQGQLSNRDVVEAENALLQARNRYAAAQANLRRTILEFHLNSGTLRVGDDGRILEPQPLPTEPPASPAAPAPVTIAPATRPAPAAHRLAARQDPPT